MKLILMIILPKTKTRNNKTPRIPTSSTLPSIPSHSHRHPNQVQVAEVYIFSLLEYTIILISTRWSLRSTTPMSYPERQRTAALPAFYSGIIFAIWCIFEAYFLDFVMAGMTVLGVCFRQFVYVICCQFGTSFRLLLFVETVWRQSMLGVPSRNGNMSSGCIHSILNGSDYRIFLSLKLIVSFSRIFRNKFSKLLFPKLLMEIL